MENLHDQAFFEFMRTCRDPYRRLADCIHEVVGVQGTAVDIGCGIGLQTKRLQELGWGIQGLDDAPAAIEMREPGVQVDVFDLTLPPGAHAGVLDTVICTETAEHIPAEHADVIVDNITARARKFIVWSAAAPGQEWEGHVNLQPPAYWLEKFAAHGWVPAQTKTTKLRERMFETSAQHVLGRQNFFVLVPKQKLHMTIISTVLNKEKYVSRCIESVQRQTFEDWTHIFIDAKSDDETLKHAARQVARGSTLQTRLVDNSVRKAALENAVETWNTLPDDEIVVWLDGDDWLAHDRALEVVAETYTDPDVWLTYGQFIMPDGTIGFASRYPAGLRVRTIDWRATHLKTFRAGLVKKIKPSDLLKPNGAWCDLAIDHAVMYPLLEMAGERYACIDRVVCVYNFASSWWASHDVAARATERAEDDRFRSMPSYDRLAARPW
jgi:2-polyprenyl-3-methyl-5-hydroxy-6-metoxy-1,4-benzoquinol methylase